MTSFLYSDVRFWKEACEPQLSKKNEEAMVDVSRQGRAYCSQKLLSHICFSCLVGLQQTISPSQKNVSQSEGTDEPATNQSESVFVLP
uniref:Uncharacterized protein n=1 Tax=Anguilla anguilla TaxID=7936 RepID=A0A0E9W457_ANGAN